MARDLAQVANARDVDEARLPAEDRLDTPDRMIPGIGDFGDRHFDTERKVPA